MKKYDVEQYPFEISPLPLEDGGGWLLSYPDVPGCIVVGKDKSWLLEEGPRVLADALAALEGHGHPLPTPGSGGSYQGKIALRVPKSMHASLVARAKAEGVSLNTLTLSLVALGLGRKEGAEA
jgi:antitoxin HicB